MKEETQHNATKLKFGGGPHGLGDPNDKFLRRVEKDILVPKLLREKTKAEKCVDEVKAFHQCCLDSGLLHVVKCRKQNANMLECMKKWFHNQNFIDECTKLYLEERSEYRRTGIAKKHKNKIDVSM